MKIYNKLVRDRIPEIIKERGKRYRVHTAGEKEYLHLLRRKIEEEVEEFYENPVAEEMGDILEVVEALMEYHGLDREVVERVKNEKKEKRGGFEKKIILEGVEE